MSRSGPRVSSQSNVLTPSAVAPHLSLLFNGLTGSLIELDPDERRAVDGWITTPAAPAPESLDKALLGRLKEGGFLVPRGFDEVAALRRLRDTRADDHLMLTVAPTMQCNFRCTYCFQEHRQSYMSRQTEDWVQRFVLDHLRGKRTFSVTWFGGEPLLHLDALERLQRFFNESSQQLGVTANTALVTNGYLMTQRTLDRLVALGPWKYVQVTVDGSAQAHDRRRPLANGRGSWATVVRNSRLALDAGLKLSVRMNIDSRNADILEAAIDELLEAGVLPYARVYLGSVNDSTPTCAHVEEYVLSRREFAKLRLRFSALVLERGLDPCASLPRPLCTNLCTADAESGFVVAPSGLLFNCWNEVHMDAEHAIGHVDGRRLPWAETNLELWANYDPLVKTGCRSCFALASCMGGCPWENMKIGMKEEVGSCGDYRFFPEEILQVAHLGMVEHKLAKENA